MNIFNEIIKLPKYIDAIPSIMNPASIIQPPAINNIPSVPSVQTSNITKHDIQPSEPFNKAELQAINMPSETSPIINNNNISTTNNTNNNTNNNNYSTLNNTYTTSNNNNFATNNSYLTTNSYSTLNTSNTSNNYVSNVSNVSNIIRDDIKLSSEIRTIDKNLTSFENRTNDNINKLSSSLDLTASKLINDNIKTNSAITANQNVLFSKIDDIKSSSLALIEQNNALKTQNRYYNSPVASSGGIISSSPSYSDSFNPIMLAPFLLLFVKL